MSAYTRAMQALERLAPEDVPLVLRHALESIPVEDWPALLLNGRPLREVEALVFYLVLGLPLLDHAEMIGTLLDSALDRLPAPPRATPDDRAAAAKLLSLSTWVQGCAEDNPQWPR